MGVLSSTQTECVESFCIADENDAFVLHYCKMYFQLCGITVLYCIMSV